MTITQKSENPMELIDLAQLTDLQIRKLKADIASVEASRIKRYRATIEIQCLRTNTGVCGNLDCLDSFVNALRAAVQEEFGSDGPHDKITILSCYEVDEHLIRSEYLLEANDPA
jgi:hypothetical protein